jgi:hypothetical protein
LNEVIFDAVNRAKTVTHASSFAGASGSKEAAGH